MSRHFSVKVAVAIKQVESDVREYKISIEPVDIERRRAVGPATQAQFDPSRSKTSW